MSPSLTHVGSIIACSTPFSSPQLCLGSAGNNSHFLGQNPHCTFICLIVCIQVINCSTLSEHFRQEIKKTPKLNQMSSSLTYVGSIIACSPPFSSLQLCLGLAGNNSHFLGQNPQCTFIC